MGYDEEKIKSIYPTATIILSFVALIICALWGFVTYNFFSFGSPLEEALAIYILGLFIVLFPKAFSNNILAFVFSFGFGFGFFYLYTSMMSMLFGAKFVPFGVLHGIFGITCETFWIYLGAIVVLIFMFSIWNFQGFEDYMDKDI